MSPELSFVGNAAFQQEAMKGRERVMSLEAKLAEHTHQLSDAQTALNAQTSQIQVSGRVSLLLAGTSALPHSLTPQVLERQLSSLEEKLECSKRDSAQAVSEKERSVCVYSPHHCLVSHPLYLPHPYPTPALPLPHPYLTPTPPLPHPYPTPTSPLPHPYLIPTLPLPRPCPSLPD